MSADSRVIMLVVVAIASLVAACSGNKGSISGPRVVSVAGVKVVVVAPLEGGMDAAVGGTLSVVGTGCLGITEGPSAMVVAWPDGTKASSVDGELEVKVDGKTVALGSQVDGSGGVLDRSDPLLPDLPKECAGLEVFALQVVESSKH